MKMAMVFVSHDLAAVASIADRVAVVYGSRFLGPRKAMLFWHMLGNKLLTLTTNILYNAILSDMETCYKCFRADVIKDIPLHSRRFEFEPEVTAKVAHLDCSIYEVGISYYGRTYQEGKKINWKDGPRTLWCILKYNIGPEVKWEQGALHRAHRTVHKGERNLRS